MPPKPGPDPSWPILALGQRGGRPRSRSQKPEKKGRRPAPDPERVQRLKKLMLPAEGGAEQSRAPRRGRRPPRNVLTRMALLEGSPVGRLYRCVQERLRVHVHTPHLPGAARRLLRIHRRLRQVLEPGHGGRGRDVPEAGAGPGLLQRAAAHPARLMARLRLQEDGEDRPAETGRKETPDRQPGRKETPDRQPGRKETPDRQPGRKEKPDCQPGGRRSPTASWRGRRRPDRQPGRKEKPDRQPGRKETPDCQPGRKETPDCQPGRKEKPDRQLERKETPDCQPGGRRRPMSANSGEEGDARLPTREEGEAGPPTKKEEERPTAKPGGRKSRLPAGVHPAHTSGVSSEERVSCWCMSQSEGPGLQLPAGSGGKRHSLTPGLLLSACPDTPRTPTLSVP
ncbi:unnamed protein product [Ranitomeya imitator]|uniref:Uncharacterized protein n=1 Tax=Ranitomeya imitator TaxID=111125 RepID=A0ABN9M040_9NEOB|nr:unnamed protein product [Ranitomeya imitator]